MDIQALGKQTEGKVVSLLKDKPMWVFWAVHSVLSGLIFAIFYTVTTLLALQWWVAVIVIIAIGMIWGSIVYSRKEGVKKVGKKT